MKKYFLLTIYLIITNTLLGQEFSFELYFEDAIGNKDTLIIGYDLNATDSIDSLFGEINIISVPLDSMFDVRITDEWQKKMTGPVPTQDPGTFHTKKNIVTGTCGGSSIITIDIHCKNWPVTASWNNLLFNDSCRNGSLLTSCMPGGWWDVPGPSSLWRVIFRDTNTIQFTSNFNGTYIPQFNYINSHNDTIPVFWMTFADSTIIIWGINDMILQKVVEIFPNPANDFLIVKISNKELTIEKIKLYDAMGNEQKCELTGNKVNINHLPQGEYFLVLMLKKGQHVIKKFIKN